MYKNIDMKHRAVIQSLEPGVKRPISRNKIYLMEVLGTKLYHGYYWSDTQHVASSDLGDYLAGNRTYWKTQNLTGYELNDEDKANIEKVKELISYCPNNVSESKYLDLCACLIYLSIECKEYHKGCADIQGVIDEAYSKELQSEVFDILVNLSFIEKKNPISDIL